MWSFTPAFLQFVSREPGARLLDGNKNDTDTKADVTFFDDALVVELKELQEDRAGSIQAWADDLCRRHGIVVYGSVPLDQVIARAPDPVAARREADAIAIERIRAVLKKASKQIRASKDRIGRPDAPGVLVLANAADTVLYPELVFWHLHDLLRRRKEDGSPMYSGIDGIWLHCEVSSHAIRVAGNMPATVTATLQRDDSSVSRAAAEMLRRLQIRWSKFLMVPLFVDDETYKGGPVSALSTRAVGFRAGIPGPIRAIEQLAQYGHVGATATTCKHCGAALVGRPDGQGCPPRHEMPQEGMLLTWFECPDCGGATDIRVADTEDPQLCGYPWTAHWEQLLAPNWRRFVAWPRHDRRNPP